MEPEIHRRLLFPGAFGVGTFLWLAYLLGEPRMTTLPGNWATVLVALVVTVPAVGFFADVCVFHLAGGYFGRRGLGRSIARIAVARRLGRNEPNWPKVDVCKANLKKMDPDLLFCIANRGGWSGRAKEEMPTYLKENARRRWTAVWASWNSAFGVLLGIVFFQLYCKHDAVVFEMPEWIWVALGVPLTMIALLVLVGFSARRGVWNLELAWVIESGILDRLGPDCTSEDMPEVS